MLRWHRGAWVEWRGLGWVMSVLAKAMVNTAGIQRWGLLLHSTYTVTGKHWEPHHLCPWLSWESSFRQLFEVLHFPWCREETQSHRAAWLLIQSKKRCWSGKGCSIFYIRAALCSALLTGKKSLCVSGGLACFDFWHCYRAVIAVRLLIASCIVWTYPRTLTVPAAVSTCLWDESLGLLNPS